MVLGVLSRLQPAGRRTWGGGRLGVRVARSWHQAGALGDAEGYPGIQCVRARWVAGTSWTVGNNAWLRVVPRVNTVLLAPAAPLVCPRPSPPPSTPGRASAGPSQPIVSVDGSLLLGTLLNRLRQIRSSKRAQNPKCPPVGSTLVPRTRSSHDGFRRQPAFFVQDAPLTRASRPEEKRPACGKKRLLASDAPMVLKTATAWAGTWLSASYGHPHQAEAASQLSIRAPCIGGDDHLVASVPGLPSPSRSRGDPSRTTREHVSLTPDGRHMRVLVLCQGGPASQDRGKLDGLRAAGCVGA